MLRRLDRWLAIFGRFDSSRQCAVVFSYALPLCFEHFTYLTSNVRMCGCSGTLVYVREATGEPCFFDPSGGRNKPDLLPTVFTAWKCPHMLPTVLVHYPVSQVCRACLFLCRFFSSPTSSLTVSHIHCVFHFFACSFLFHQFICRGADVMLPGTIPDSPAFASATVCKKGN